MRRSDGSDADQDSFVSIAVFEERGAGFGSRAIIRRDHEWLSSKLLKR